MKAWLLALSLLALSVTAVAAGRDAGDGQIWHFGGFGTLGAAYHGSEGLIYRRDLEQAKGYEGGRIGFRGDSRLGVQAAARFDSRWSALVQAVSRLDSEGGWEPQLSWTFLRFTPSDVLDIRLGRLGVDIYMDGDSRHVGYAFTTARPSSEVLGIVTQDLFDGMDVTLRHPVGTGVASLRLYGGRSRGSAFLYGTRFTPPEAFRTGLTAEWASENLTVRLAWGDVHTENDDALAPLAGALAALPVPLAQVRASQIDESHHLTFMGVGALYQRGPFFAQGLLSHLSFSQFPRYEGWNANLVLAWRVGSFKPFLSWSHLWFDPQESRSLTLSAPFSALQAAYDRTVQRLTMDQQTFGVGVRYDFARDYALKFQIDRVLADRSAILIDKSGMPARDVGMTLYSIALDFVF